MKTLLSILGFFAYSLAYVHTLSNILYPGLKDDLLEQPIQFMSQMKPTDEKDDLLVQPVQFLSSKKTPHSKITENESVNPEDKGSYVPYDFNKFDEYLHSARAAADRLDAEHNRVKRRAKRRRNGRRRRVSTTEAPHDDTEQSSSRNGTAAPDARRAAHSEFYHDRRGNKKKNKLPDRFNTYESANKQYESTYVEMPKDLYQAHLRPGVIFRIHMAEAILKMQYRNYGEDKDESVIEADVEYLRLTRKVISDEITKFEDLKWLTEWFTNRSELVQEHACNTRYYAVGIPPTLFTHPEEYMKRMCLFDNVYIDHIPYVVGEDNSLMAAVAPPVLHCDAATCTSVPFIDSIMFEERLPKTNVRTLTRCQASCRAHCRNDPDCLKRCSDRCMRAE